ncbi:MAG: thioesterase family protein [Bacteroidota bacterium]
MSKIAEDLAAFPIQCQVPVQWGDMDAFNHVNNIIYLRWSETGRIKYFDALNLSMDGPERQHYNVILGYQDCKYIFPLTYPDTAMIGAMVTQIGEDRFTMQCRIFSERHDRLAAIVNSEVVTIDYKTYRKVAVPDPLRKKIAAIEGRVF